MVQMLGGFLGLLFVGFNLGFLIGGIVGFRVGRYREE